MKTPLRSSLLVGFSAIALTTSMPAAVWVGGNNANDWNTGANWSGGVPNGAIADVTSGTAVLSTPAPNILRLRIGATASDTGTVIMSSSVTGSGATEIARAGTGTLIVNAGANFQVGPSTSATYRFGVDAGSLGVGIHNGGTVTSGGTFSVGVGGTGQYTLAGGAVNALNNATIAASAGGAGTYTQSSGTLTVGSTGVGGSMFVGQGGAGTMNLSGGRVVASLLSVASGASASGTVTQTGGTIDLVNGPNQTGGTNGQLAVSERGTYSISGGELAMKSAALSGDFNITGADATITVVNDFSLTATGTITFAFDAVGMTSIVIGGNGLFDVASVITVNGADYAGANGTFTLIDAATFNNTPVINLVGFDAGSSFNWDTANGVFSVTVVPEPGTVSLLLGGGLLLGWMGFRRRKA